MKKILNLILALIIVSANIMFAAGPVYAADDAPPLMEDDDTSVPDNPLDDRDVERVVRESVGGDSEGKLKVELYEPIGNENIKYILTTCTATVKPDNTQSTGYKIEGFKCSDAPLSDQSCLARENFKEVMQRAYYEPLYDEKIYYCRRVQVFTGNSGSELIQNYVGTIYKWAAGTIGIVAVLVIVVSGIEMIGSDISGDIDAAKSRIGQSLIGLAILFLSAVILYTINPNFFF